MPFELPLHGLGELDGVEGVFLLAEKDWMILFGRERCDNELVQVFPAFSLLLPSIVIRTSEMWMRVRCQEPQGCAIVFVLLLILVSALYQRCNPNGCLVSVVGEEELGDLLNDARNCYWAKDVVDVFR